MQPNSRRHIFLLVAAILAVAIAGCGRPAPEEANTLSTLEIPIAGVSVTSPDAVVAPAETVLSPTTSITSTPAGPTQKLYTIEAGDTMSGIAAKHGIAIDDLARANGITDVNSLRPGDELVIPIPAPVDVTVVSTAEATTNP